MRRLTPLAILLLAGTLAAGCTSPPDDVPDPTVQDPAARPGVALVRSVQVDATRWSGEPSILALQDGTLLITGAGGMTRYAEDPTDIPGNAGQSYLWRSTDGGANWTFVDLGLPGPANPLLPYRSAVLGVEGDLAADGEGRTYLVDLTWLATNGIALSTDSGATWANAGAPVVGVGTDRPWIAADVGSEDLGAPAVVVKYLQLATGHRLAYFAPMAGGALRPVDDVELPPCGQTPIVVDRTDPGAFGAVVRMACTDNGLSVLTVPAYPGVTAPGYRLPGPANATPSDGIGAVLAVGSRGYGIGNFTANPEAMVLAWADAANGTSRALFSLSLDDGQSWSEPLQLNSPGSTAVFPWIDIDGNGTIAAAWYEAPGVGNPDTHDAAWTPRHAMMRLHAATGPFRWVLTEPAYTDLSDHPVHDGPICRAGLGCVLDGRSEERRLLDFFELDVDAHGVSHVTWTDNSGAFPTIWYGQVAPRDALAPPA